ncbi:MAG: diguanylate cyclase [Archangium gephyra]|uniref:Diguanylate cyclase n=1 Tax=Archangium gephyra TaxID=48 RepID=A0A2W5T3J8_9BACT|nr:MAG: diguanylate cyclase [Archangium gephyra]
MNIDSGINTRGIDVRSGRIVTVSHPSRLLLIDDTRFARDVLQELLTEARSKISLDWRSDYATGLEALLSDEFDVCLLDVQLGERSGLDLLRDARARGVRMPIVVLTGHGSDAVDDEALRAGASDYLVKGDFSATTLDRMVRYLVERSRSQEALRDSEERFSLAMEGSNDGLWDWRVDAKVLHLSARWKRIIGFEADELADTLDAWFERIHEDDRVKARHEFTRHLEGNETPYFENEHRLQHKDGSWRHVLARGKAVRDGRGRATRMVGSLTDITLAKSRDPLTGLPNRVLFLDRLEHSFHRAARDDAYRFSVLFIDLDRFKNINDSLGHDAGDELLVSIARRLERCVRLVDTVARMGGDEFVVLLDESREPDGATRVASRIIEELGRPFRIAGRELFTGASVGIAMSAPQYLTPGELLRDADNAMYRAKAEGRGRFVIFDSTMHARAMHVLSVESGLRRALEDDELEVFYQPVVAMDSGRPVGFEALVRWRHPERGLISPADFIPVAEDSSLIVLLDLHVLKTAALQLKAWRDSFGADLSISVNASRRHFSRSEYAASVQQAISHAGLPPTALRVEVTESVTMDLPESAKEQLEQLHRFGVRLFVDDFGVGYSSLSMLHTYPFSGLKLDRSFVSGLDGPGRTMEIVRAIFAIAQTLKLEVVAEGVETEAQHHALFALGCTRAQGYRYGKPMTREDAETWLQQHA